MCNNIKHQIKAPPQLKYDFWKKVFEIVPDKKLQKERISQIKNGIQLGIDYEAVRKNRLSQKSGIYARNIKDAIFIINDVTKELKKHHIITTNNKPSYIMGMHTVPKNKHKKDDKWRNVRNGSKHEKYTTDINRFQIGKDSTMISYTLQTLAHHIYTNSKGCDAAMTLLDLKSCYRQFHLCKKDYQYAGIHLLGRNLIDTRGLWGYTSMGGVAQAHTSMLLHYADRVLFKHGERYRAKCHIDDIILVHPCASILNKMSNKFINWIPESGFIDNKSKRELVIKKGIVYGWQWNVAPDPPLISLPNIKIKRVSDLIDLILEYKWITIAILSKVAGYVLDISQIYPQAKAMAKRFIVVIYYYIDNNKTIKYQYNNKWIYISDLICKRLKWWKKFINNLKDVPITRIFEIPITTITIASDACLKGYGWYTNGIYSANTIPPPLKNEPIHILEIYAVITALTMNIEEIKGKYIKYFCDNQPAVKALIRRWSKNNKLHNFVLTICELQIKYNFHMYIEYLESKMNWLADRLSRFQFGTAQELCKQNNIPFIQFKPSDKKIQINQY